MPDLRLIAIMARRKSRDGKTGMATSGKSPRRWRQMNSALDISEASNSSPPPMRSNIIRAP
jgi:hypothetical protein